MAIASNEIGRTRQVVVKSPNSSLRAFPFSAFIQTAPFLLEESKFLLSGPGLRSAAKRRLALSAWEGSLKGRLRAEGSRQARPGQRRLRHRQAFHQEACVIAHSAALDAALCLSVVVLALFGGRFFLRESVPRACNTELIAFTSARPCDRSSISRWPTTFSSSFSPRGCSTTSTCRRSSRPRTRLTQPRVSSRSTSSTMLWWRSNRRSASVRIVASSPSGSPRIASSSRYCCASSPASCAVLSPSCRNRRIRYRNSARALYSWSLIFGAISHSIVLRYI